MPILDKAIPTKNEKEWKEYKEGWRNSAFFFLKERYFFQITRVERDGKHAFNAPLYN